MLLAMTLAGLVILLIAGDMLVKGAVALSLHMGVPVLIVGLTVVAFGTSAPELLVSVQAALMGVPGIAIGNVVGSNIANILVVLGLPALVAPILARGADLRRSTLQMLAATAIGVAACLTGPLTVWHGLGMLGLFALVMIDMAREAQRNPPADPLDGLGPVAQISGLRTALFLLGGLIGLPIGAQLLVDGASGIALRVGVSEAVIGLTLVAVGTSLPELVTTLIAAIRREVDVALGNVIGSNIFNILAILGVTSLFGPVTVDAGFIGRDLWVMALTALILVPLAFRGWAIGRIAGIAMLLGYGGYLALLAMGWSLT